jgi:transcriptional regulator with XRE-family HTH domain
MKNRLEASEDIKILQEHVASNYSTALKVPLKLKDEDIAFLSELRKAQKTTQQKSERAENSDSTLDRFLKKLSELDVKKDSDLEALAGQLRLKEITISQYEKEKSGINDEHYYQTTSALETYKALSSGLKDSIKGHD